jgi:hypothetical protein
VTSYRPTQTVRDAIRAADKQIKRVVEGRNPTDPKTPGRSLNVYWSLARTLNPVSIPFVIDDTDDMSEEICQVWMPLRQHTGAVAATVRPGETAPTVQLVTFKDSVTVRLTSNDLAAQTRPSTG